MQISLYSNDCILSINLYAQTAAPNPALNAAITIKMEYSTTMTGVLSAYRSLLLTIKGEDVRVSETNNKMRFCSEVLFPFIEYSLSN